MMMAIVGKLGGTVSSASLLGHLLPRQAERKGSIEERQRGKEKGKEGEERGRVGRRKQRKITERAGA